MSDQHPRPGQQPPHGQQQPGYGQQPPGYGQPPPTQGYYAPPPPKKSHTLRNVLLVLLALFILFIGGCLALIGGAANEIDNAIEDSEAADREPGGPDNPLRIEPGEAFEVSGFSYKAGWTVGADAIGDIDIKGLRVENGRDSEDSALVDIKFWRGNEVLALTNCTTEPIAPGTVTRLSCLSADDLPRNYSRITINDTF